MQRKNGRAANSLREIRFETGYTRHAEGSVLASFGETRVLCTATLEEKVPSFLRGSGRGWITAEYGMLPRSTHTRNDREAARGKQSGRTLEIQRLIGRSLRMSVPLDLLGERQVILDCDVIQADGGTRTAAISGAWVALSLALDAARAKGVIANNLVVRPVAGVSVGRVNGKLMLDLDYEEDSTAEVDLNVVAAAPRIVEVQGTAEREPFERAELDAMLDLALEGIEELHLAQIEALRLAGVKMEGLK